MTDRRSGVTEDADDMERNSRHRSSDVISVSQRLARLETGLQTLGRDVEALTKAVGDLVRREGRPNYTAWGVAISAIAIIGSIAAVAVSGPIEFLDRIGTERTQASIRDRERLGDRLDQAIRDEQVRNNQYGERLGRLEAMYDLLLAGRLRTD